jgi:hypothetical protein
LSSLDYNIEGLSSETVKSSSVHLVDDFQDGHHDFHILRHCYVNLEFEQFVHSLCDHEVKSDGVEGSYRQVVREDKEQFVSEKDWKERVVEDYLGEHHEWNYRIFGGASVYLPDVHADQI